MNAVKLVEIERTHEPVMLVESDMAQGRGGVWAKHRMHVYAYFHIEEFWIVPVGNNEWTYEPYTNQPLHQGSRATAV